MTTAQGRELPRTDDVNWPASRLQRTLRPVARFWYGQRYDVRVRGAEHVPASGPVLVAPNHVGFLDGPLVAAYTLRPVHLLTKVEMFEGPMGIFLRSVGQIPLSRLGADPAGIKICVKVLRDGGVVGIFPEGSRGPGDLSRFHGGLVYLALVTGAPVVPLAILGTREPGGGIDSVPARGARFDLEYGDPVYLAAQPWPRTRDEVRRTSALLQVRLHEHLHAVGQRTGRSLPGPLPDIDQPEDA